MKGRIGLRITSSILFLFSFILFLSGCVLQRRSVSALERYYDSMPLPDTHPLSIEKKRRKSKDAQNKGLQGGSYGDQQRVLLSSATYSPLERQQELEKELFKSVGYVQMVAEFDDICNAVLVFSDLDRVGSRASKVLMYPAEWDMQLDMPLPQIMEAQKQLQVQMEQKRRGVRRRPKKASMKVVVEEPNAPNPLDPPALIRQAESTRPHYNTARRLLHLARIRYSAILLPVPETTMSPLVLLNMTDYNRLLYLSHPAQVMRNMDDLLLHAPPAVVASPRAIGETGVSPHFLLVSPSESEFGDLKKQQGWNSRTPEKVKGLLERLYSGTAMILPRWPYEVYTSELFRSSVGARTSTWSAKKIIDEAYNILFDGARTDENNKQQIVPQPWKLKSLEEDVAPQCAKVFNEEGEEQLDCTNRKIWGTLYEGFRRRRMEVCGLDLEA
ncbi:hypothetical protein H072_7439 [Dactylellina haptotyla CBS 200.50]|uniref:N-acetylglucosaminyltransferase n=1 Tax=Dactylellina haptotyla (strain CBS 200.50) TaxID=1284197 RepID=S8ACQ0_DACHA|nr:hypothetical protein H072_7439 [Dactylellina haptotyla CBS 200.50]